MKFTIDANVFIQAVKPAADIALKKYKIYDNKTPFGSARMITMESKPNCLEVRAYGGTASIIVKVNKNDGYLPDTYGAVTVQAAEFLECLKSFQSQDKLVVSCAEEKLTVGLESDEEVFNRLTIYPGVIVCPNTDKKSVQSCVVNKDYFVKGLEKVAYAMADEKKMFSYMCLVFETEENTVKFAAGSGGRFTCFSIEGSGLISSKEHVRIIMPKSNIENVIRILKGSDSSELIFKTVKQVYQQQVPEQIVLENGNMIIGLYGTEDFSKYPDLQNVLNHKYTYQITTKLNDWKPATDALNATYCCNTKKYHNTNVTADLTRGFLTLKTNTEMEIQRKIGFMLGPYPSDSSESGNNNPWFSCNSKHLLEIVPQGRGYDTMTLNFDDQENLSKIPEGKPKQMMPVRVTYPVTINEDGTKEKYSFFFAVSTKW